MLEILYYARNIEVGKKILKCGSKLGKTLNSLMKCSELKRTTKICTLLK